MGTRLHRRKNGATTITKTGKGKPRIVGNLRKPSHAPSRAPRKPVDLPQTTSCFFEEQVTGIRLEPVTRTRTSATFRETIFGTLEEVTVPEELRQYVFKSSKPHSSLRGYGYEYSMSVELQKRFGVKSEITERQWEKREVNFDALPQDEREQLTRWSQKAVDVLARTWEAIPKVYRGGAYLDYPPSTRNVNDPSDIYVRDRWGRVLLAVSCKTSHVEDRAFRLSLDTAGLHTSRVLRDGYVEKYPNMTWYQRAMCAADDGTDETTAKRNVLLAVSNALVSDMLDGTDPAALRALESTTNFVPHFRVGENGSVEYRSPLFDGVPVVKSVRIVPETLGFVVTISDSQNPGRTLDVKWRAKFKDNWRKTGENGSGIGYTITLM